MEGVYPAKSSQQAPPSKLRVISDAVALALTTVILLGVYAASYLATVAGGSLVKNTTAQVSNIYFTQVRVLPKFVDF